MSNDENKHVEICCHNISYYCSGTDMDIDDDGRDHIEQMITDGVVGGSLNITDSSGNNYYGYWRIER